MIFSAFAIRYSLPIYTKSTSISDSGAVTADWSIIGTLSNVEIQPVDTEVRRELEGSRESAKYKCFHAGIANINDGDRVKDPLASSAPSNPDMEIFMVEKWEAVGGLPAHTEFMLRKLE